MKCPTKSYQYLLSMPMNNSFDQTSNGKFSFLIKLLPNLMISGTDYPKDNFVIHGGFLIEILLYRRTSAEVRHVYREGEKFR